MAANNTIGALRGLERLIEGDSRPEVTLPFLRTIIGSLEGSDKSSSRKRSRRERDSDDEEDCGRNDFGGSDGGRSFSHGKGRGKGKGRGHGNGHGRGRGRGRGGLTKRFQPRQYGPPGEGYVCKNCNQKGGQDGAHWIQQCPHPRRSESDRDHDRMKDTPSDYGDGGGASSSSPQTSDQI